MDRLRESDLQRAGRLHFIGAGGSGIYPLIQILHAAGKQITGSDNNETETTAAVRKMGIPVTIGHFPENVDGADLIIYSAAIKPDNAELAAAAARGIPAVERSEMLGLLTHRYGRPVNVSGTHGKTTTTAMLTQILLTAGLDPSAMIGGKLPAIGGSGRVGKSDLLISEACEFVDTFLHMKSYLAVILNVDADHLDYFGSLDGVKKSFRRFAEAAEHAVLYNLDDPNTVSAMEGVTTGKITFGEREGADYRIVNVEPAARARHRFELHHRGQKLCGIALSVPGRHNVHNAAAAAAAAHLCGACPEMIALGLSRYAGAGRRFELLGHRDGYDVVDDYAHHPAELRATLTAAMGMGYRRVVAVFQPFTYSRTKLLFEEFVEVLQIPDETVLTEIMGGREQNTYGVESAELAARIPGSTVLPSFQAVADYIRATAGEGDLVITLGCGDIYKAAHLILGDEEKSLH